MKTIIEIRGGSGGDESKLLVNEQFGIYYKTSKTNNLWVEILEETPGYISFSVEGKNSYKIFQNESGGHQFMRVSPTDKKGRVHTSLITVSVLKVPENNELNFKESDCEYRFIKSYGNGGQNAQKNSCGVIIKHLPTGLEAKSTSERSQLTNKTLALDALKSKLFEIQEKERQSSLDSNRKKQIGSGHRSDKIRTIRCLDGIVKCEISGRTKSLKAYLKGELEF